MLCPVECAGRNVAQALERGFPFPWDAVGEARGLWLLSVPQASLAVTRTVPAGLFLSGDSRHIWGAIPSGTRGPTACGRRNVNAVGRHCESGL